MSNIVDTFHHKNTLYLEQIKYIWLIWFNEDFVIKFIERNF